MVKGGGRRGRGQGKHGKQSSISKDKESVFVDETNLASGLEQGAVETEDSADAIFSPHAVGAPQDNKPLQLNAPDQIAEQNALLKLQVEKLQGDLKDAQRAFAESHNAFAEQMTTLQEAFEKEKAEAVRTVETSLLEANATKSTAERTAKNAEERALAAENALSETLSKSHPAPEALADIAKKLGYSNDTNYTLAESYTALYDEKIEANAIFEEVQPELEDVHAQLKATDHAAASTLAAALAQLQRLLRVLARTPSYQESTPQTMPTATGSSKPSAGDTPISAWEYWIEKWEIPRKILHGSIGFGVLWLYVNNYDTALVTRNLFCFLLFVAANDLLRLNLPFYERIYEGVLGVLMREGERERVTGVLWYLVGVICSMHFFPEDIAAVSIMILSWCDPCASMFGRLFGKYTPALPSIFFARRKSLAGFLAAVVVGMLVAFVFWGTGLADMRERNMQLSWSPHGVATFGSDRAPGLAHTGWMGLRFGFQSHGDQSFIAKLSALGQSPGPAMPPWLMYIACGLIAGISEALELGGIDDNLTIPILSALGIWGGLYAWGRCFA
ncbi:diacylglycerol kinase (CTP) [Malassezia vespertilionis]|uniref:diacylglycerol kinase (CTP) n=1 Tax=Malassezia vespertilionis TaxID=2020962 RepID=UPI0024B255E5|nr:diacylglycerol kinase (CTP) [Malassezia vespertilionis]WFD07541.1 diacylglycerol kinase (CTP) [Malassezia vespertilionis]